jgi:hypothetical protein
VRALDFRGHLAVRPGLLSCGEQNPPVPPLNTMLQVTRVAVRPWGHGVFDTGLLIGISTAAGATPHSLGPVNDRVSRALPATASVGALTEP